MCSVERSCVVSKFLNLRRLVVQRNHSKSMTISHGEIVEAQDRSRLAVTVSLMQIEDIFHTNVSAWEDAPWRIHVSDPATMNSTPAPKLLPERQKQSRGCGTR